MSSPDAVEPIPEKTAKKKRRPHADNLIDTYEFLAHSGISDEMIDRAVRDRGGDFDEAVRHLRAMVDKERGDIRKL
jgi:hypothetical protein